MSMPLLLLPKKLLSEIQKKMTPPTFCRLRQTCRAIDDFTENNRFIIKVNCIRPRWTLLIAVGEENEVGYDFEVIPYAGYVKTSVEAFRESQKNISRPQRIFNPFYQLSASRFNAIIVNYSSSSTFFESDGFKTVFLPLMQELRLECSYLCFYDAEIKRYYTQNLLIQKLITFQSLTNYTAILTSDYLPIETIKKTDRLGYFLDNPSDLGGMIKHLEFAWIAKAKENNHRFLSVLEEFLEEVCVNREARGSLIELTVRTELGKLMKPTELVDLWKGDAILFQKKQKLNLLKLPISDGNAIIEHWFELGQFVVHFINIYNRKGLYNLLSKTMFTEVFKSPGVYDSFFAAENDLSAMEALNPLPPAPQALVANPLPPQAPLPIPGPQQGAIQNLPPPLVRIQDVQPPQVPVQNIPPSVSPVQHVSITYVILIKCVLCALILLLGFLVH